MLENLITEFNQRNIPHSTDIIEKIKLYIKLIEDYNSHTNILGAKNIEEIIYKHILDCALGYHYFPPHKSIADVGTGAGLPGLLLAILGLGPIYLVESKQKKAIFLKQTIEKLKLKNAFLCHQNVKEITFPIDVITCRAFVKIKRCLPLTAKMRTPHTEYIFYKGTKQAIDQELAESPFKVKKIVKLTSSFIPAERHLVIGLADKKQKIK